MIHCTSSGCNPTCQRLHPHVLEAAPLCARGYDPMHPGCNPTCPGARLLHQLLRRVSAALGGHPAADGHGATGAGVLGRGGRELLCAMGRDRRGAHGAGVLKVEACKLEGRPHGRRHDARRLSTTPFRSFLARFLGSRCHIYRAPESRDVMCRAMSGECICAPGHTLIVIC